MARNGSSARASGKYRRTARTAQPPPAAAPGPRRVHRIRTGVRRRSRRAAVQSGMGDGGARSEAARGEERSVRWSTTALAAPGVSRGRRWQRLGGIALAMVLALAVAGSGSATVSARAAVFTGYGFDACTAPDLPTLGAWLASPYRAIGIYVGGVEPRVREHAALGRLGCRRAAAAAGTWCRCTSACRRRASRRPRSRTSAPQPPRRRGRPPPTTRSPVLPRSASIPARRSTSTWRATPSTTRRARRRCRRSSRAG